jgi:hypothetical protein
MMTEHEAFNRVWTMPARKEECSPNIYTWISETSSKYKAIIFSERLPGFNCYSYILRLNFWNVWLLSRVKNYYILWIRNPAES